MCGHQRTGADTHPDLCAGVPSTGAVVERRRPAGVKRVGVMGVERPPGVGRGDVAPMFNNQLSRPGQQRVGAADLPAGIAVSRVPEHRLGLLEPAVGDVAQAGLRLGGVGGLKKHS